MLCSVNLVGTVVNVEIDTNGVPYLVLQIERPFLDSHHLAVNDQFIVYGWGGISQEVKCYYQVGDYICIRGRLENHPEFKVIIIAEYTKLLYRKKVKAE